MDILELMIQDIRENFPGYENECQKAEKFIPAQNATMKERMEGMDNYLKAKEEIKNILRKIINEKFVEVKNKTGKNVHLIFTEERKTRDWAFSIVEIRAQSNGVKLFGTGQSRLSARAIAIKNLSENI